VRLVSEAGVTRATFYRHFPTKEALVEAYLRVTDADLRRAVGDALAGDDPRRALLDLIGHTTDALGFRGCHFINAAAEYPGAAHPVRIAISDHRAWFRRTVTGLARPPGPGGGRADARPAPRRRARRPARRPRRSAPRGHQSRPPARFGARLCVLGMDRPTLTVAWPPRTREHARHVALEHTAFSELVGTGFDEYAEDLVDRTVWHFWWD
jgi:AcrR family transcriptional regulator